MRGILKSIVQSIILKDSLFSSERVNGFDFQIQITVNISLIISIIACNKA
jgi:hypothetical protein